MERGEERCSKRRRAPVEGDAVPYECGERKDYCWHLTANNKHPKISCPGEGLARSFLGLNTISTNKIPRFCPLRPLTPAPRPKDRPLILPQPYETLHVTDCRSHLCHITSLRLPIRCPKHAFHKPCPGRASASDIAPVKCICTCWWLRASRLFLYTCSLLLSEISGASRSLPCSYLHSRDLVSTARLSVRPSSYLPFA